MSNILFSKHSFICAEQKTGKESSKGPITYMALENVHLGKENCFHWKPPAASDLGQTHAESTWLLLLDRQGYRSTSRKINGRKIRKIRSHPSRQVSKCTRGHSCLLTEKGLCNHSEALGSRSWEPVTAVQQIPSSCINQQQSQLTLPQLLPRTRASVAQPHRSRQDLGLARSRSTGRGVPF